MSQQFKSPFPAQAQPPAKKENTDAWIVVTLVLLMPIGLYFMWKDATWSNTTKTIVTIACAFLALVWLMYNHVL